MTLTPLPHPAPVRPHGAVSLSIDPALRLLGAEPAALALIARLPGLISLRQGRLYLPQHHAALESAVAALTARRGGAMHWGLALHRPTLPPLTLKLERTTSADARPVLLVHVVDPTGPQLDPQMLVTMFGLTAAELRVALLLAQGLSTEEAAGRLGVQDNTVRSHIKQLLSKTHTHRQAQFVALLWRSAAVIGPAPAPEAEPEPAEPEPAGEPACCQSGEGSPAVSP